MRKLGILFAAVFIFTLADRAAAQSESELSNVARYLYGEWDIGRVVSGTTPTFIYLSYGANLLFVRQSGPSGDSILTVFEAGRDVTITGATLKTDDPYTVVVALSDKTTALLSDLLHNGTWTIRRFKNTFFSLKKLKGDALYGIQSGKIWASRDTARTWSLDTIGIGGEGIEDIALDGQANVYAVSQSKKLWFQHRDSSEFAWRLIPEFSSSSFPTALFIDRLGRMFVASRFSGVQVSTDAGKSWTDISTGVEENIDAFGDDDKGNVYAVGQTSGAYRLSNLTPPWTLISDGISSLAQISAKDKIITSITGNSVLYATTRYGIFTSTDLGDHWTHAPNDQQSRASTFYTPLVRAQGTSFLSSNLGIFRAAADGMPWEKVFPQDKYCWGINSLASDAAGNLYGDFPFRIDATVSRFYPAKSTDLGAHWDPDTLGQGVLKFDAQIFDHYVDAQGTQWLGGNGALYCKRPGQPWIRDTNGLGLSFGLYIRQVSRNNKKGVVYTAIIKDGKYSIYSRAVTDNTWTPVDASILDARDGILQSDQNGDLIVKTLNFPAKLWKYDGQWKQIPIPSSLTTFDQFLADGEGNLWIMGIVGGAGAPSGLWVSTDNGANWRLVGLDGVPVKFLSADKDTVYAVTAGSGVFKFTKNSTQAGVAFHPTTAPLLLECRNQPNPFKPSTRIDFELPSDGSVTLSILDLLGNEVAVLLQGPATVGLHSAVWDATGMPSGMYECRLQYRQTNGAVYSTTHKLLLSD